MAPYPKELRIRVVAAVAQGDLTIAEVANVLSVGQTFVKKMLRLHRAGEDLTPRHGGGLVSALQDPDWALLRAEIQAHPDAMLAECQKVVAEQGSGLVSLPTLCRALRQLPRKKKSPRRGTGRKATAAVPEAGEALGSPPRYLCG